MLELMKRGSRGQMSEALVTALFLSFSGGLQDAYTYIQRGGIFANAQTGNIVLLSANLMQGQWRSVMRYLIPILFFALGVAAAEMMRIRWGGSRNFHWRQSAVLCEIVLLFSVGFFPRELDLIANATVSFACAMQVQAFRKMGGSAFSSTMCIGNLRSGMEALCRCAASRDRGSGMRALRYFSVILMFALGAGTGSLLIPHFGFRTIWFSCLFLAVSFALMFIREKEEAAVSGHP